MILRGMVPRVRGREVAFYIFPGGVAFLRVAASSNKALNSDRLRRCAPQASG